MLQQHLQLDDFPFFNFVLWLNYSPRSKMQHLTKTFFPVNVLQ